MLPAGFDQTKTHTLGIYATRALGAVPGIDPALAKNYYANVEFDFRPDGAAVTAKWDKVREIRAELDEQRAKVPIDDVEVVEVDHRCRPHDPGVLAARPWIGPLLGSKDGSFLLCLPDEQHPFFLFELPTHGCCDVVFPLPFLKRDEWNLFGQSELLDCRNERPADRIHQRRRCELLLAVVPEEPSRAFGTLQLGHVGIQVHPVNPLQLQGHVVFQKFAYPVYAH